MGGKEVVFLKSGINFLIIITNRALAGSSMFDECRPDT